MHRLLKSTRYSPQNIARVIYHARSDIHFDNSESNIPGSEFKLPSRPRKISVITEQYGIYYLFPGAFIILPLIYGGARTHVTRFISRNELAFYELASSLTGKLPAPHRRQIKNKNAQSWKEDSRLQDFLERGELRVCAHPRRIA